MTGQSLAPGARLGPYQILEAVGAGGMGEVYKAMDTRLERVVAVKLLNRQWVEDGEMRQRFEREAQIIASLSHPNICVLHDIGKQDGVNFLVMEFLEGESLGARLSRGAIDVREALKISIAIADALDKAHRHGVVHRDLKPANVVLAAGGPKLLDFGLAKREAAVSGRESNRPQSAGRPSAARRPGGPPSQGPTLTNLTTPGAVMGTLQYMAPEQLAGEEADARTDIFSFGAMLHEMITGRKAFEGKSRILLMSAIATANPEPLSSLQEGVPKSLDNVVKACLAKDPAERWQSTRDLLAELEWCAGDGAGESGAAHLSTALAPRRRGKLSWIPLAAAAAVLAATALPAALYFRGPRPEPEFRIRIPMAGSAQPYDSFFGGPSSDRVVAGTNFAVSPDGKSLAYLAKFAAPPEPYSLYVRPVGSVTPQKLLAIEDGAAHSAKLFWSADSRFIGFFSRGKLKKVEASGGPSQDICDAAGFYGGTWNRDGAILFGSGEGLFLVSGEGGKPQPVTTVGQGEGGHYWPHFLPDGRRYLYTAWNGDAAKRMVVVGTLGSKEKTTLFAAESNTGYAAPGFLVFHRGNAVYAQPFDWKKPALSGEPSRVADEVSFVAANGWADFGVTPGGVLSYFQNSSAGRANTDSAFEFQMQWVDRGGVVINTPGPVGLYRGIEASPDGKRIAVHRHNSAGGDIIVVEPRGSTTSLTFDATRHNSSPVWSPNGDRIAYAALAKGKWGIYQNLSSGSGTEELLHESELPKAPMSWSPDGKRIVFWTSDSKNGGDLWVLTLDDKKAAPLISTPFQETHGQISPDGKWIAYTSNSTGRHEVYVQPFPTGSGRYQISFHGGDWPRWRGDSKELFYHAIATTADAPASVGLFRGGSLLSSAITVRGGVLEPESPKEIVRTLGMNEPHSGGDYQMYSVSADGKRILTLQFLFVPGAAPGDSGSADPPLSITVARNWTAGLKK